MTNNKRAKKSKMGRPTKFDPKLCDLVYKYALLGLTDQQLADALDISLSTLKNYKTIPEFLTAHRAGKEQADSKVAESLYEKAVGGDVSAATFWLKNRQGAVWRDKQHVEHSSETLSDLVRAVEESYYEPEQIMNGKDKQIQ
jgi:hypothetical protein